MAQELGSPPEVISDLAEGCVTAVEQSLGVQLDFTQDTLPLLDHYVRQIPEDPGDELVGLLAPMCGAYFGEVVRRHFRGARWHAPEDEYEGWRVEFEDVFLHFNPVGIALEALLQQEADGYGAHLQLLDTDRDAVRNALDSLGAVPEEEYYRFSTRFEVLDQAHALLVSRNLSSGKARRLFGRDVYAAALGERRPGSTTN